MITIQDMSFNYPKSRQCVLSHISETLQSGRIYGLLGKNGIGKSTLLRLICGANPPTSGTILTMGHIPFKRSPAFLKSLFFIPEDIEAPKWNIDTFAKIYSPFYPTFDAVSLRQYIDAFEINRNQKISSMSMGERKKTMIAFALACKTRLLLMDEPTNGLDIPCKRIFRKLLNDIHKDTSQTIIISTHQVRDLEQLIDAVMIVHDQKIVLNATEESILKKYTFGFIPDGAHAVYKEYVAGKPIGIMKRNAQTQDSADNENHLDIELLFNAAISGAFQNQS